jgi:hypothetical protein
MTLPVERALRAMAASIPDAVANSAVAIVGANRPTVRQFGSGTLLAVADRCFVVTAAHVVRQARDCNSTIGITGAGDDHFIATPETWIVSQGDSFDLAICPLDQSRSERLAKSTFVRISDVSFETDLSHGFFVVFGFPGIWSTQSTDTRDVMQLRALRYSTYAYGDTTAALEGYDNRYHLLLDAKPEQMFDASGATMRFTMLSGHPARMPEDLRGISGCGVWMIGDLTISCEKWRADQARLVGVETGVFGRAAAIKATRWNAVMTLLYEAVADVRSTIRLYAGT